jgi:hypothetical protein
MIDSRQAASALKDATDTERRSSALYRYQRAAPYFFLWGGIWLAGYGASDLWPRQAGLVWIGLLVLALAISMMIGRAADSARQVTRSNWRYAVSYAAIWSFFGATYAVMGPVHPIQQAAFPPLVVSLVYVLTGLWSAPRFIAAGLVLAALTLGGFFWLPQHFLLWEGACGGAALLLAGFWFRRV